MENSKIKKYLISSSLFLGANAIFVSSTISYPLNNKEDVNTYSDLLKDKLIKRSEFQSVNYSLYQNGKISPKEDKKYRIKLLLKYELENSENIYQDVSLFSEKNKLFLDNIVANLKNEESAPKYHWQINWTGFMANLLMGGLASEIYNEF
ncbi:hypothetical protein ACW95P_03255 [Candidatus Mycoplasma pogonae]